MSVVADTRGFAVPCDDIGTNRTDDDEDDDDDDECCACCHCPAQLFTSVMLGILACVLVTGGVFLAFHKWDYTWLLVSGVGILLMGIGTALHCCSTPRRKSDSHRCKGGCGGRHKSDVIGNGSVLTEQLLPLSNARSVSQLSLNMLPGYFPPLVYTTGNTPYGIEQHSTVVQNISKLVQHQTQLHLQAPSQASGDPGAKSFILVPLPSEANAANIQNIVAAVCQLDNVNSATTEVNRNTRSCETSTTIDDSTPPPTDNTNSPQTLPTNQPPLVRHAEVQTCSEWHVTPSPPTSEQKTSSSADATRVSVDDAISSSITCHAVQTELNLSSAAQDGCPSSEVPQSIINVPDSTETILQTTDSNTESRVLQQVEEVPSSMVCVQECTQVPTSAVPLSSTLPEVVDNIESSVCDNSNVSSNDIPVASILNREDSSTETPVPESNIPHELPSSDPSSPELQVSSNSDIPHSNIEGPPSSNSEDQNLALSNSSENVESTDHTVDEVSSTNAESFVVPSETVENFPFESSQISAVNTSSESLSDLEESDLFDRSSPPPSYDDVAQETSGGAGAYGMAYGTM